MLLRHTLYTSDEPWKTRDNFETIIIIVQYIFPKIHTSELDSPILLHQNTTFIQHQCTLHKTLLHHNTHNQITLTLDEPQTTCDTISTISTCILTILIN